MSCGVGCRRGSDLALLWLAAIAPIRPLVWELPYATGVALKSQKKKKKEEEEEVQDYKRKAQQANADLKLGCFMLK